MSHLHLHRAPERQGLPPVMSSWETHEASAQEISNRGLALQALSFGAATQQQMRAAGEMSQADFRNPRGVGMQTGGGVMGMGALFGDTRQHGNNLYVGEGMEDAEIPVGEMTKSHLLRDSQRQMSSIINHHITQDPNMYVGPKGLMPFVPVHPDDTTVTMDTMDFQASLVGAVPELAPTRILSHTKKTRKYGFMRIGLGVRNSTDFMQSAAGRKMFGDQIKQIMGSFLETACFAVLYALVTANDINREFVLKLRAFQDPQSELKILEDEIFRWDISKRRGGFELLDAKFTERVKVNGGTVDTWILTPKATILMAFQPSRISVSEAGESSARTSLMDSVDAVGTWGHYNIMHARSFAADMDNVVNPLRFRSQIGEHYIMRDPFENNAHRVGDNTSADYGSVTRSHGRTAVQIYNEESNRWDTITNAMALRACGVFKKDDTGTPIESKNKQFPHSSIFGVDDGGVSYPKTFYRANGTPYGTLGPMVVEKVRAGPAKVRSMARGMAAALWQEYPAARGAGAGNALLESFAALMDPARNVGGDPEMAIDMIKALSDGNVSGFHKLQGKTLLSGAGTAQKIAAALASDLDVGETVNDKDIVGRIQKDTASVLSGLPPFELFAIGVLMTLPFTRDSLLMLDAAGVTLPITFLLLRPHMEYNTLAGIKTRRGVEMGATYTKPGQFTMGQDPLVQEVIASFTMHSKAIVKNEKDVIVAHGICIDGLVGGANTSFFMMGDMADYDPANGLFGEANARANRDRRNETENGAGRASIYSCMIGGHTDNLPNPLTLHGSLVANGGDYIDIVHTDTLNSWATWAWYEEFWGWRERVIPSPDPYADGVDYVNEVIPTNAITFLGHTRRPNVDGIFGQAEYVEEGTGHWAQSGTYIGCKYQRAGEAVPQSVQRTQL